MVAHYYGFKRLCHVVLIMFYNFCNNSLIYLIGINLIN